MQLLVDHHFAHDRVNNIFVQFKDGVELFQTNRVIVLAVGEQVCAETFFLDFSNEKEQKSQLQYQTSQY
jgi:hypothetical protein